MRLPGILRAAVSSGYSTAAAEIFSQKVFEDHDWPTITQIAIENNLGPLLFDAFRRLPAFSLPSSISNELHQTYIDSAAHHMVISHKLRELLADLSAVQVPVILLKGAILSTTVYPDPALRPMVDIDLLIPFTLFDVSCSALEGLGYRRNYMWPMENKAGLYFNELDFISGDASRCIVELHWNLIDIPYFSSRFKSEELFERAVPVSIGDESALTLAIEDHLLYLATHNTYHHMGSMPMALIDIGYLLNRYESSIDWPLLIQRAIETELSSPLQSALLESYQYWYGQVPESVLPWLYEIQPTLKERLLVKSQPRKFTRVGRNFLTLPGFRLKISYLKGHAFPSRNYLTWRYHLKPGLPPIAAHYYRINVGIRRFFGEIKKLLFKSFV